MSLITSITLRMILKHYSRMLVSYNTKTLPWLTEVKLCHLSRKTSTTRRNLKTVISMMKWFAKIKKRKKLLNLKASSKHKSQRKRIYLKLLSSMVKRLSLRKRIIWIKPLTPMKKLDNCDLKVFDRI